MEVIAITSQERNPSETQRIIELFESGLDTLLIKKPKWSSKEVETFIEALPNTYHKQILIHGHYHLALKYGLKGIHLRRKHRGATWKNRLKRIWLKIRRPNLVICTTFNSLESIRENRQFFDFVFLSSVFSSRAYYHKNEDSGVNMLRMIVNSASVPVYATGGVRPEHLSVVKLAGFRGVGLASYVWKSAKQAAGQTIQAFQAA
jgi:thiamine-phosphate pyrophosphorylase